MVNEVYTLTHQYSITYVYNLISPHELFNFKDNLLRYCRDSNNLYLKFDKLPQIILHALSDISIAYSKTTC